MTDRSLPYARQAGLPPLKSNGRKNKLRQSETTEKATSSQPSPQVPCNTADGHAKSVDSSTTLDALTQPAHQLWICIGPAYGVKSSRHQDFREVFGCGGLSYQKPSLTPPAMLPSMPPPKLVANAIFLEFCKVYKALENSLVNAKAIHASQRRIKDPLQIYRDLQRERAEPVQTIVVEETLQVTNTNANDDSTVTITLDHDLPMGLHSIPIQGVETQVSSMRHQPTASSSTSCRKHRRPGCCAQG